MPPTSLANTAVGQRKEDGQGREEPSDLALRSIIIQYAARLSPRSSHFCWPSDACLLRVQHALTDELLPPRLCPPAPTEYQRALFKSLLARLDVAIGQHNREVCDTNDTIEIDERILEHYAELLTSASASGSHTHPLQANVPVADTITYLYPLLYAGSGSLHHGRPPDPPLEDWSRIELHEEGSSISQGTTGLKTWEASLRLGRYLLRRPEILRSHRILELGSGVGFLGILSAQIQKDDDSGCTYLTDLPGVVLDRLRQTVDANGFEGSSKVMCRGLDWLEVHDALRGVEARKHPAGPSGEPHALAIIREEICPTLIIAADVVFDPALSGPLADVLHFALGGKNDVVPGHDPFEHVEGPGAMASMSPPTALVASTVRNAATYQGFLACLRDRGLSYIETELDDLSAPQETPGGLPLFPSAHIDENDGRVTLLAITVEPKPEPR